MKQKEITLFGKQFTLGYCYATEISYKTLTDEDITDFVQHTIESLQNKQMPDTRKSIFFILASIISYYESHDEKAPVTDKQLMYELSPTDMGTAIGTILNLRGEFYHVPSDEPKEKPTEGEQQEKNA